MIRVTQLLVQTLAALKDWDNWKDTTALCQHDGDEEEMKVAVEGQSKAWKEYSLRKTELEQATAAACLAISDDLWKSAQAVGTSILQVRQLHFMPSRTHNKTLQQVDEEALAFIKAARRELGIVHIDT